MLPNLKKEMDRRGIKQCRLAQVAGVSERTVYSWLNQDGEPGVFQGQAIRRALFPDLSGDYLFDSVDVELSQQSA